MTPGCRSLASDARSEAGMEVFLWVHDPAAETMQYECGWKKGTPTFLMILEDQGVM